MAEAAHIAGVHLALIFALAFWIVATGQIDFTRMPIPSNKPPLLLMTAFGIIVLLLAWR